MDLYGTAPKMQQNVVAARKIFHSVLQRIGEKGNEFGEFGGNVDGLCVDEYGVLIAGDYENKRVQMF